MDAKTMKLTYIAPQNEWRMAVGQGTAKGPGHYDKIKIDHNDTGELTFQIINSQNVNFANDGAFVEKPNQPSKADFAKQFSVLPGGAGTQKLVVKDANSNGDGTPYAGGDYHYELHFSNGTTLDPVITNGGCCQAAPMGYLTFLAIGLVALAALYVLLVRPMMARNTRVDSDQG